MPKEKEIPEEEPKEDEDDDSEEEGLEEELEDVETPEIKDLEFSSFIQPTIEESAPVLERLAGSQRTGFSLSGWEALASPVSSKGTIEEGDPSQYSIGGGGEEGGKVKYVSSEQGVAAPTQVDFGDVGRRPEVRPEVSFTQSSELRDFQPQTQERYEPAKRMDTERAGRRDPFERKDPFEREGRKYEFKSPKS